MRSHQNVYDVEMRITVNLPDDVHAIAASLAQTKHVSLGDAIAELVRRGLAPQIKIKTNKAFPHFALPSNAAPITFGRTLTAEDEL